MFIFLILSHLYLYYCARVPLCLCALKVYMGVVGVPVGPAELFEPLQLLQGWQRLRPAEVEGWEVLWKFLRIAAPLLVHSWFIPEAQGSKRAGRGEGRAGEEEGLQGHGHMLDLPDWPYYTRHILPSPCSSYSFCVSVYVFFTYVWVMSRSKSVCLCVCVTVTSVFTFL